MAISHKKQRSKEAKEAERKRQIMGKREFNKENIKIKQSKEFFL